MSVQFTSNEKLRAKLAGQKVFSTPVLLGSPTNNKCAFAFLGNINIMLVRPLIHNVSQMQCVSWRIHHTVGNLLLIIMLALDMADHVKEELITEET